MRRWDVMLASAALSIAAPLHAQEADVGPAPASAPAPSAVTAAPAAVADSNVAPYYAAHPGTLLWLRDADSRAAAAKLAELLKNSPIDGLSEGPALAAKVEAALASGLPADDPVVSEAWVRYVQALRRPVSAVSFGDPSLKFHVSSADAILSRAAAAATPSLAAY